jgi:plastocyanin
VLAACVVGVAGAAATTVALAATAHDGGAHYEGSHHRSSHVAKACRRARHHPCPKRHKHKRKRSGKHSAHTHRRIPGGSGAPGASPDPRPAIEGSRPGTSAPPPSPGDGPPVAEAPTGPSAPARVQVIAKEYSFTLSRTEVPAGRVILEFVNNGEDEHNLHAVEPTEGSAAGEVANTAPGAHEDLTLTMRAGSYTLFCSLPKHEEKGMKATLVVK